MTRRLSGAALAARRRRLNREAVDVEIGWALVMIRRRDPGAIADTLHRVRRAAALEAKS